MVAGTGLPIKDRAPTLLEPPPRAQISTAGNEMLGRALQGFGETVSKIGEDRQKLEDARMLADIRRGALETSQNTARTFATDPEGYDTAMKAFAEKQMQSVPSRYINAVRDEIENVRLAYRDNIMRAQDAQAKALANDAMKATHEVAVSRIGVAAYSGDDTQLAVNFDVLRKTLNDGVASGQFSAERAKLLLDDAEGHAESERMAGTSYKIYQKEGADGVRRALERFKSDQSITMDMAKRERLEARVLTDMHQWETRKNADVALLDRDWDSKKVAAKAGIASTSDLISLRDAYLEKGRPDKAREVDVYVQSVPYQRLMATRPIAEAEQDFQRLRQQATLRDNQIAQRIAALAPQYGLDSEFALTVAKIESGFNPNAKTGKFSGIYQLDPESNKALGAGSDAESQVVAGLKSIAARKADLANRLGREPAPWELYLAHQQGAAGAEALLKNPDALAVDVLKRFKDGDPLLKVQGNIHDKALAARANELTAGDFAGYWKQRYSDIGRDLKGGVDPEIVKILGDTLAERKSLIVSDPMALVLKDPMAPPQPAIDWSNPQAATAALQQRDATAKAYAQSWRVAPFAPMDNAEIDRMHDLYDAGGVPEKLNILTALTHGVSPQAQGKLLTKIAKDKPELAVAVSISAPNRKAAEDIVRGSQLLKEGSGFNVSGKQIDASLAALAGEAYPGTAYEHISRAVKSHYAASIAMEGKPFADKGVIDAAQLQKSYNAVTGGNVIWNGRKLPPAFYGQTPEDFSAVVAGLTDADFAGAVIREGGQVPYTANDFMKSGALEPLGGGKYGVIIPGIGGGVPIKRADGSAFKLDLSNRRPVPGVVAPLQMGESPLKQRVAGEVALMRQQPADMEGQP